MHLLKYKLHNGTYFWVDVHRIVLYDSIINKTEKEREEKEEEEARTGVKWCYLWHHKVQIHPNRHSVLQDYSLHTWVNSICRLLIPCSLFFSFLRFGTFDSLSSLSHCSAQAWLWWTLFSSQRFSPVLTHLVWLALRPTARKLVKVIGKPFTDWKQAEMNQQLLSLRSQAFLNRDQIVDESSDLENSFLALFRYFEWVGKSAKRYLPQRGLTPAIRI